MSSRLGFSNLRRCSHHHHIIQSAAQLHSLCGDQGRQMNQLIRLTCSTLLDLLNDARPERRPAFSAWQDVCGRLHLSQPSTT